MGITVRVVAHPVESQKLIFPRAYSATPPELRLSEVSPGRIPATKLLPHPLLTPPSGYYHYSQFESIIISVNGLPEER